jgi:hypothetical protein
MKSFSKSFPSRDCKGIKGISMMWKKIDFIRKYFFLASENDLMKFHIF